MANPVRLRRVASLGVAALLHDVGSLAARHPVRHAMAGVRWVEPQVAEACRTVLGAVA